MEAGLVDAAAIAVEGHEFGRMAIGEFARLQHLLRTRGRAQRLGARIDPGRALAQHRLAQRRIARIEIAAGELRRLVRDLVGGEMADGAKRGMASGGLSSAVPGRFALAGPDRGLHLIDRDGATRCGERAQLGL